MGWIEVSGICIDRMGVIEYYLYIWELVSIDK